MSTFSGQHQTGANTILDILKESELLVNDPASGKLIVGSMEHVKDEIRLLNNSKKKVTTAGAPTIDRGLEQDAISEGKGLQIKTQYVGTTPTIAINIELKIPPSESPVVYENLFSALRKNLLEPIQDE